MANRWLTPNTPASGFICRRLFIPNGLDWLQIVSGALLELCAEYNFEDDGTSTARQTADAFWTMYRQFSGQTMDECPMIGQIMTTAYATAPLPNWLPCDGRSVLRADYPALFAAIGTVFGSVDSSHFNLPDLQGRAVVGSGSGSGLTPRSVGNSFGEETHTLSTGEMPAHTHTESTATASVAETPILPIPSALAGIGITGSAGSGDAHNNLQPSLVLSYWIVAF